MPWKRMRPAAAQPEEQPQAAKHPARRQRREARSQQCFTFSKADGSYVREVRRGAADDNRALKPYFIALQGNGVYISDVNNMTVSLFWG